ncbi:MAG: efflux RND transporter periplasmic adaptor subunit [Fimbriimonas sp.]
MRKTVLILVIALVGLCGVGGYVAKTAMAAKAAKDKPVDITATLTRSDLIVSVIESGTVDATRTVDVKSRVTGRLKELSVEEGDMVTAGQRIAVIDPKETVLKLEQDQAQLNGAVSAVSRQSLEIEQRRKTAMAAYNQAKTKLSQLELEMKTQPTLTNALIASAQTQLHSAEQDKVRLIQSVHPTQRTSAQATVDEAQANYNNSVVEYKRQSDLFERGYVSGRAAQSAKLATDVANVRLQSAKDNLAKLDAQLRAEAEKADQQILQARAELTRAKANAIQNQLKRQDYLSAVSEVERARAALSDPAIMEKQKEQSQSTVVQLRSVVSDSQRQLGETDIRAPISGVVTKKGMQVGELATGLSSFSSGSTIIKIEDRRVMRVKLDVNEIDVARMTVGMTANVDVDAIPDHTFKGIVRKIAPASKEAVQGGQQDAVVRYEVEIELTSPIPSLRSGMTAKCTIDVIKRENVLTLPVEFVTKEKGKYYVYVAPEDKKGKPTKTLITVGAASGTKYEVLSGIKEGDTVQKPKFDGPERKGMMSMGPEEE